MLLYVYAYILLYYCLSNCIIQTRSIAKHQIRFSTRMSVYFSYGIKSASYGFVGDNANMILLLLSVALTRFVSFITREQVDGRWTGSDRDVYYTFESIPSHPHNIIINIGVRRTCPHRTAFAFFSPFYVPSSCCVLRRYTKAAAVCRRAKDLYCGRRLSVRGTPAFRASGVTFGVTRRVRTLLYIRAARDLSPVSLRARAPRHWLFSSIVSFSSSDRVNYSRYIAARTFRFSSAIHYNCDGRYPKAKRRALSG